MKKIIAAAHCILNPCAKVASHDPQLEKEAALRQKLLQLLLTKEISILQLPCPEFSMYGPRRWGHVKEQFENPFYRKRACELLSESLDNLAAYSEEPNAFQIIGIIGIDGSPSCGINKTCSSKRWFGEFSSRITPLADDLQTVEVINEKGVFMEVLQDELAKRKMDIPFLTFTDVIDQIEKDHSGKKN